MKRPDASIVVVHHRGSEHLYEALAALEEACRGRLTAEVIVVDNASGLPVAELLRRHPTTRRVVADRNVGFAAGCRLGAEAARAPALLFVNDDAVVEPETPLLLAEALSRAEPDVVAVAGRLTDLAGERNDFSDGFLTFDGHAFQNEVGKPVAALAGSTPGEERLFACGGLMAVRRGEFLSSGGFDDDYFAYLEDVDFGWRQWIFGRRIVDEPRARARHRGGATGEALGVFSRGYLFEKNAFATAYKNFDRDHFAALMPSVLAAFLTRISEMIAARNPGAEELARDPYAAEQAPSMARRLFGISERCRLDRSAGRSADARSPPGSPLDSPEPGVARREAAGSAGEEAASRLRDLREVSAPPRVDVSGGRAIRLRVLPGVPRVRAAAPADHARGDLRGSREVTTVLRRHPDAPPARHALPRPRGARAPGGSAGLRGRGRGRRVRRLDPGPAARVSRVLSAAKPLPGELGAGARPQPRRLGVARRRRRFPGRRHRSGARASWRFTPAPTRSTPARPSPCSATRRGRRSGTSPRFSTTSTSSVSSSVTR